MFIYSLIWMVIIIGCKNKFKNNADLNSLQKDSVSIWVTESKNKKNDLSVNKKFLLRAFDYNKNIINDSIKNKNFLKITYQAYRLNDSILFKKFNKEAQEFSIKIKDTFGIGDTHWNYGNYYGNKERMEKAYYHYFEAYKNFKTIGHEYYTAKMLYNMAFIQARVKDYTGSEISIFQAITIFKKLDRNLNLYKSYNQLGINFTELQEYNKAILYHNKALTYLKKVDPNKLKNLGGMNNLGFVYQKQGNFQKAEEYFKMDLDKINSKNTLIYARLIDNLAYTKLLKGDTLNLLSKFNEALRIRDSLDIDGAKLISCLHLAEYYAIKSDTLKAVNNALRANFLAKQIHNNRDILASLFLLSKIDKKNSSNYLNEYVVLNDSLQIEERKLRDKFTRIRFETDEYIEETEKLSEQKIFIILGSLIVVIILALLYFIKIQQTKNKELVFEKEQQQAKEEIYELLLKQQSKLEEGRNNERQRISEDLHDGVLGKLFGTRMGLGFLNINGNDETAKKHSELIDELQTIEMEIRTISHELKNQLFSSQPNFISIIEELVKNQSQITGFKYAVLCDENIHWNRIDENIKINFYRIVQEAIQNINKYAKATFVNIDFNLNENILKLTVIDNGIGFNSNEKVKGIGLKNMESRALKLEGEFVIKSTEKTGTVLTFMIPL